MCGIAGLSVGCPLSDACQKQSWLAEAREGLPRGSTLDDVWDRRASVRSAPRRRVDPDHQGMFSARMVPVLNTDAASGWSAEVVESVKTHHLFRYLNFTVLLESLVVNPALLSIHLGRTGVALGPGARLDALRMYTDEAYHSLAAADIAHQVEDVTGVRNRTQGDLTECSCADWKGSLPARLPRSRVWFSSSSW